MAVRQMRLFWQNADFFTLRQARQGPLRDRKKINVVDKPFHQSTIPEILVKIGPLASEKRVRNYSDLWDFLHKSDDKVVK